MGHAWRSSTRRSASTSAPTETNRLKQYIFIPLDLNTATDEQFKTIPNLPGNMLREFKEYRPVEDEGAVRQGDRQVRRRQGDGTALALHGDRREE